MKPEGNKVVDPDELKKRTKEFAHRCIKVAAELPDTLLGRHIRGQLIRCATSVASNYRAVCLSQSRSSFAAKLSIVIEEADESRFWLEFIAEEGLIKKVLIETLLNESDELTAIFIASRKTARRNEK